MNNITQTLKVILLAIIISFGASYAFAWVAPSLPPTGGNSAAPLNTSSNDQIKNGNLFLNALGITNSASGALNVAGGAVFGGDVVANSGITLGGVTRTVWPSDGGVADWNTIINKPIGFSDNVDDVRAGGGFKVEGVCSSGDYYNTCAVPNPATGSCTCPTGFTTLNLYQGYCGPRDGLPAEGGYICFK